MDLRINACRHFGEVCYNQCLATVLKMTNPSFPIPLNIRPVLPHWPSYEPFSWSHFSNRYFKRLKNYGKFNDDTHRNHTIFSTKEFFLHHIYVTSQITDYSQKQWSKHHSEVCGFTSPHNICASMWISHGCGHWGKTGLYVIFNFFFLFCDGMGVGSLNV